MYRTLAGVIANSRKCFGTAPKGSVSWANHAIQKLSYYTPTRHSMTAGYGSGGAAVKESAAETPSKPAAVSPAQLLNERPAGRRRRWLSPALLAAPWTLDRSPAKVEGLPQVLPSPEGLRVTGWKVIRTQPVWGYGLIGSVRFPRSGSPGRRRKRIIGDAAAR